MRYCETCRAAFQALRTCPNDGTATRPDIDDPLLGHVLGDRYRVLEPIAAGGMGQVYRAAHTRIASLFAVKVLYGDLAYDPSMRSRFQREAEAASCLQSRYIVRVIDFSESEKGLLYIAMEHLAGQPLAGIIDERGVSPARAVSIAVQIARGLAHAHERGIVHRDLKPGNVMLVREDDEPDVVRLLDFGIARLASKSALTQAGSVMGTPEYMAPEQFRGSQTIDGRADLYALGIMLYEMLSGALPFYDDDLVRFAHAHFYQAPPPLKAPPGGDPIPPELERIVMRLLEKAPASRFASGREVVDALKAVPLGRAGAESLRVAPSPLLPEPIAGAAAAERMHGAIGQGAPVYNAGDHAGCANIYQQTAQALLGGGLRQDTIVASSARLDVAIRRAGASRNATRAAWELRWAFDDLVQVLRAPGAPTLGAGAPSRGGFTEELATELAAAATIAAPRYAAQELDLVAEYFDAFATRLAARSRERGAQGAEASVAAVLEAAVSRAKGKGTQTILQQVGATLDHLREGARDPASSVRRPPPQRCAAEARYAVRITDAIRVGAPAYNAGDQETCARTYRDAAREIADAIARETAAAPCASCSELAELLRATLDRASQVSVSQAAWALRHTFDEVLAAATLPTRA